MKKVTIQDIAKQMNLSRNTVAKALNDGAVSYETKISVLQTAYEMGYAKLTEEHLSQLKSVQGERNGLVNNRAVLVLSGRSQEVFWNRILAGISAELNCRGYRMLLQFVEEQEADEKEIENMLASDVDGMILLNVFPEMFIDKLAHAGLPMTFYDAPPQLENYLNYGDVICPEGWFSMESIVERVIAMGYRDFGFMGYVQGAKSISDRYGGCMRALERNGLKMEEKFSYIERIPGDYYDYHEVEQLVLEMTEFPEVFVCANDVVAKHIACALHKKDPDSEEKLVLIGFDHTVEAGFFRQNIYSVDVNKEDIGKRLAKSVLDQIADPAEHALIFVRTYPDTIKDRNRTEIEAREAGRWIF